jgi:hypothetical protein
MYRLSKDVKLVSAISRGFEHCFSSGVPREQNDCAVRAGLSHQDSQLNSRQSWHDYIRNQEIGSLLPDGLQSLERIGERRGIEALLIQNQSQGRRYDGFIINNKDAVLTL